MGDNMVDNSRVVLEDGIEYLVISKIEKDDFHYVYLMNKDDDKDLCVRKEIMEDEKCYLVGLDNKEEADEALKLYIEKNKE